MKTPCCLLVGALAVACTLSSCVYDDGSRPVTAPYTYSKTVSDRITCGNGVRCGSTCATHGRACAACACAVPSCAPVRVQSQTEEWVGVSRYPTTWGAPEITTLTLTTRTWLPWGCRPRMGQ